MTTKVYSPTLPKSIPDYFQSQPEMGQKGRHGDSNYTVYGFLANCQKRATHLFKNQAAITKAKGENWHYPYCGTITVLSKLTLSQHGELLKHLNEQLKLLGIIAAYNSEITRKNQVNHHYTIREAPEHLMRHNARKLRDTIRKTTTVRLNQQYKPLPTFKDAKTWVNYCGKLEFVDTKTQPKTDDVDALLKHKPNKDIYKAKRVLFIKPPKGQRMFHIFGVTSQAFWEQTPTASEAKRKQRKGTLKTSRKAHPVIEEAAQDWAAITGQHPEQIERHLYDERANATPEEQKAIDTRNEASARAYHGDDYEDYMRCKHEQRWLEEQRRRQQRQRSKENKAALKAYRSSGGKVKPFDPAKTHKILPTTNTYLGSTMKFGKCTITQHCNTFGTLTTQCKSAEVINHDYYGVAIRAFATGQRKPSLFDIHTRRTEITSPDGTLLWENKAILEQDAIDKARIQEQARRDSEEFQRSFC